MIIKADSPSYLLLVQEKAILEKRVDHLDTFVKSCLQGEQTNVSKNELELLEEQLHYMRGYLRCLSCRIGQINSDS